MTSPYPSPQGGCVRPIIPPLARTGWLDGEPARVTSRMEIRPAAELGPIILCLDTSGSMKVGVYGGGGGGVFERSQQLTRCSCDESMCEMGP